MGIDASSAILGQRTLLNPLLDYTSLSWSSNIVSCHGSIRYAFNSYCTVVYAESCL